MDNQQRLVRLAFLAGIITGEGCFTLIQHHTNTCDYHLLPAFVLAMKDPVTMLKVAEMLKEEGLSFNIKERTKKGTMEIRASGLKRVAKYTEALLPYLTGKKKRSAEVVDAYIRLRLSKPHKAPIGPEELSFLLQIREINSPWKPVKLLRDYTPKTY